MRLQNKTSKEHYEKYKRLCVEHNIKATDIYGHFGFSGLEWQALWKQYQHLNNVRLTEWDSLAASIRLPGLSLAEKVCTLKHYVVYQIIGCEPLIVID